MNDQLYIDLRRNKRDMPSLYAIAEHWLDRDDWPEYEGRMYGLDEPFCAGCKWLAPVPAIDSEQWGEKEIKKAWVFASRFLDRAHLVDHMFDGSDQPSNMVPLCFLCHHDMPPFKVGEQAEALAWVRAIRRRPFWFQFVTDHVAQADPARQREMTGSTSRSWLRKMWVFCLERRALERPDE